MVTSSSCRRSIHRPQLNFNVFVFEMHILKLILYIFIILCLLSFRMWIAYARCAYVMQKLIMISVLNFAIKV